MSDRNIFLSIIENDDDSILRPDTLFAYNSKLLFPDINVDEVYPEIELFVETLESFYHGMRVFLSQQAPYSIKANLMDKSEELVLGVSKVSGVGEMPWYLITPLGTFYLEFLSSKSNAYIEHRETILTDEMKEGLFLVPCEYEFNSDSSGGQLLHVYDPHMPFPPLKPEAYVSGSLLEKQAREYWRIQEIKEKLYEAARSVYDISDDPYVELVDAEDGSITRLYGEPEEIIKDAQEAVAKGEASGFRFYDSENEDFYSEDDEPDLIDEVLEEFNDDEDDDEDDWCDDDLLNERDDDWQQAALEAQIDTIHYVIRPED